MVKAYNFGPVYGEVNIARVWSGAETENRHCSWVKPAVSLAWLWFLCKLAKRHDDRIKIINHA